MAAELERWTAAAAPAELRVLPRASLHLTLAFLGERSLADVAAVEGVLASGAELPVRGLELADPVWLPRRRPGVLAVAVADDLGELRELQAWLVAGLRQAIGFTPEARPFFPHVTVARVRGAVRVRPHRVAGPVALEFAAERVGLFASTLGAGGARYRALAWTDGGLAGA